MGIEDAERRFLGAQPIQNQGDDGVLHHIGEAAGMEDVAVIHGMTM